MDEAHQSALLWFGEIMRRRLFRNLGCATINQYAVRELGFSKSRTDDFIRLARKLENLPAARDAVASGKLGYTKAREIVSVATPETQEPWLEAAKGTRKNLIRKVGQAKRAARVDPGQGELLSFAPPQAGRGTKRQGRVDSRGLSRTVGNKGVTGTKVPPGAPIQ